MKELTIYTAAAVGEAKSAAVAVFCNEKGSVIKSFSQYLDNVDGQQSQYLAAIFALSQFESFFGSQLAREAQIEIRCDMPLLVSQINGRQKIEDPRLNDLFIKLWNLTIDFKKVKFIQISTQNNSKAVDLAHKLLGSCR